jgi:hypothetical protein
MQFKMESIEKNQTCKLVDLPEGKQPITTKWVYKVKVGSTGKSAKLKARIIT